VLDPSSVVYEADRPDPRGISIATGELYDVAADPWQWHNRWDDPALRRHLLTTFAPELEHLRAAERATIVAALESATSFAAWDNLRVEQRLSAAQARAAVTTTVVGVLGQIGSRSLDR